MSKAFVKEDEGPEEGAPLPPRPKDPLPITPRGLQALREERAALVEAGQGTSWRARTLAQILETVVERAPALQEGGAGFGCIVTVEHEDGSRKTYEIVGPDEADPSEGRLSVAAPIARALLGSRAGDLVTLRKPRGDEEVTVLDVSLPER